MFKTSASKDGLKKGSNTLLAGVLADAVSPANVCEFCRQEKYRVFTVVFFHKYYELSVLKYIFVAVLDGLA